MFRKENKYGRVPLSGYILILTLAVTVLFAGLAVSYAWMHYSRTLQTATLVKVSDQTIVGPSEDSLAIKLGDVDVSVGESKSYVFGVHSNLKSSYRIQLAHTINIPFTYTIFSATKLDPGADPPQSYDVEDDGSYFIRGNKLNPSEQVGIQYYNETYGSYNSAKVQPQANPVYWLSDFVSIDSDQTQYYILQISWSGIENSTEYRKETDMVYLTVGAGG